MSLPDCVQVIKVENETPAHLWHYQDSSEINPQHLIPAMSPVCIAPKERVIRKTGALKEFKSLFQHRRSELTGRKITHFYEAQKSAGRTLSRHLTFQPIISVRNCLIGHRDVIIANSISSVHVKMQVFMRNKCTV